MAPQLGSLKLGELRDIWTYDALSFCSPCLILWARNSSLCIYFLLPRDTESPKDGFVVGAIHFHQTQMWLRMFWPSLCSLGTLLQTLPSILFPVIWMATSTSVIARPGVRCMAVIDPMHLISQDTVAEVRCQDPFLALFWRSVWSESVLIISGDDEHRRLPQILRRHSKTRNQSEVQKVVETNFSGVDSN